MARIPLSLNQRSERPQELPGSTNSPRPQLVNTNAKFLQQIGATLQDVNNSLMDDKAKLEETTQDEEMIGQLEGKMTELMAMVNKFAKPGNGINENHAIGRGGSYGKWWRPWKSWNSSRSKECYSCGKPGHIAKDC